jgi:sodium/hydrogen antiporter
MGDWTLPAIALLLMGYAAASARLRSTVISQAMLFVAVGLLFRDALHVVEADVANLVVRHLAEVTLGLVLFTDAVRVNIRALRREIRVPARLLCVGLPLTIVVGMLAGMAVFPELDIWTAAALATVLAPTDAALGLPVVTNRRLPSRIRQGLNIESGLNDGVCVPLLIIFLTIAQTEEGVGGGESLRVVGEEIGFGALAGIAAGAVGAWVLRVFADRGWMDGAWKQINSVATPVLAYTVATALGGSGFIAAFVAGICFGIFAGDRAEPSSYLAEQSGELLGAVTFLLFGAVLLAPGLDQLDWRIAVYAVLSLTVVRMVPVALAMLGVHMRWVTVAFLGWFGPRGLASIVFVLLLVERTQLSERALILAVVTWTVSLSVYLHGLTAWPGANRYAAWYEARAEEHAPMPESVAMAERRTRGAPAHPTGNR